MKNLFTIIALVAMSLFVFTACEEREEQQDNKISGMNNGHEYVDLGLSVKWATCNVGAKSPEEDGDYFAWGEVVTKEPGKYWENYKYCAGEYNKLTKYCSDSEYGNNGYADDKIILDLEDDAAHVNWGGTWRMPTKEEQDELRLCDWKWTKQNDVYGYKIIGDNGNSIFMPAIYYQSTDSGRVWSKSNNLGLYWSSSLCVGEPDMATYLYFEMDGKGADFNSRWKINLIRPVCP